MGREIGLMVSPDANLSLVQSALAGDEEALARIMATHHGDMSRVCMVITGDVHSARDAVQAAWPIAWRRLPSLRDASRLRPWLISIAANEARQLVRSEARRRRRERRAEGHPPPDERDPVDRLDLVAAVQRLDRDSRRLIGLRYVADLTSEEIAREVGSTPSAVRGRLARIVARLREEMNR
jgi:RNA polymerase sigma-70 factor (ECF subfamily)